MAGNGQLQSLAKAIDVAREFSREKPELGVAELAAATGHPKSVVHRIVQTLEQVGFLEQNPISHKYTVGLLAYEIGSVYFAKNNLRAVVVEELKTFARECGHTCYFGRLRHGDAVLLAVEHGSSPVRIAGQPGERLPAHATALGKALLARLGHDELEEYLAKPLREVTPKTITDGEGLRSQLKEVRARGYAVTVEETYPGVCAVGAVVDGEGAPTGAVAASIPVFEYSPGRVEELGQMAVDYARRIRRRAANGEAAG